jgi:hypothetical protein
MGSAGSAPAFGRVAQVCADSAKTITWFANPTPGASSLPVLAQNALAADGTTVVAGTEAGGLTGVSQGCAPVMTRALLGCGISAQQEFDTGTVDLTLRGGEPGLPGGFAVTEVNGVPAFLLIYVGAFDATGELALPGVPLTGLSGFDLRLAGGGFAKGGVLAISSARPLAVL